MDSKQIGYQLGKIGGYVLDVTHTKEDDNFLDGFWEGIDEEATYQNAVTGVQELIKGITKDKEVKQIADALADLAVTEDGENVFTEFKELWTVLSGVIKEMKKKKNG